MENYNPRQNTRMRWKDAKELEKFKFISGEFSFITKTLEQASKHKPWSKIVEVIENGSAYKPVLIFDIANNEFYFGTQENDELFLQTLYANQGYALEIQYDHITDKLTITSTEENYLTDPVKTGLGQSIIGTGNIDLYYHQILVNDDCYFNIPSSSDLPINSTQDLTNLLKPTIKPIYYFGFQKGTLFTASLEYDKEANLWKFRPSNGGLTEVTTVSDVVIPV